MGRGPLRGALAALVWMHLAITMAHGFAHRQTHVPLSPAGTVFVAAVIFAGPLAGLLIMRRRAAVGAAVVAATMAASLAFGVMNHFVVRGADHVAHVDGSWRALFGATAVLLAVTEAAAAVLGTIAVRRWKQP